MAVIIFWFKKFYKSLSWSLLILKSSKFTFEMTFIIQQGSCWKYRVRVELAFTWRFGHASEAVFICGKINSRYDSPQFFFFYVSLGQHNFNNFCNLSRLILTKGSFTQVLTNHEKRTFPLKRAFLGETQRPVKVLSN